ncbi:uncharacterized protein LOC113359483 [Papaver somniferum]|uniref:uncharacterized protein LOC113359483 n=1 Tax=Papaver somniferum TaxID=3469 RepID=UPI000E6F6814|nr:uncharacterized protein LOC113359483 [Papaver somniferum]
MDLGYTGSHHIWTSRLNGQGPKRARLDLELHNSNWIRYFPESRVKHLPFLGSDHFPILLCSEPELVKPRNVWKFYRCWLKDPNCSAIIAEVWNSSANAGNISQKLGFARRKLSKWNIDHFGRIDFHIRHLREQLSTLQSQPYSDDISCKINVAIQRLNYWKKVEADFWHQKSGDRWLKDSGKNGFQAGFFLTQWSTVGNDVVNLVQQFFERKIMPPSLNHRVTCLIPKARQPSTPNDYRPISLCNIIYKIISKLIVIRMKPLMDRIISPTQAAYVPQRLTNDNIVMAHELVHSMKKSRKKQDDVMLFFQADQGSIEQVKLCLQNFGNLSGQMINFSKSSAFIAGELCQSDKLVIIDQLGVKKLCAYDKYLGLPILLGKSKNQSFSSIKDAYENRLQGWCSKTLNQAARSTLVKSVLNSIPSHYMSNFKLPNNLIKQLDSVQRKFWWGHKSNRGLNLLAWNSLCVSKDEGGLAFRNIEKFNLALITKLAWRLCNEEHTNWVNIMKAKYSPYCSFIHLQDSPSNSSWILKSIEVGLQYVKQFHKWDVRSGENILVWYDKWVAGLNSPHIPRDTFHEPARIVYVSDLMLNNPGRWNEQLVWSLFPDQIAQLILKMQLVKQGTDKLVWEPNRTGKVSVKTVYKAITQENQNNRSIQPINWKKL